MITTEHIPHRPAGSELAERGTHPMPAGHPFVGATCALLDHRTHEATIPALDAPVGRYLAFEDAGSERLLRLSRPITHLGRGLLADIRLEDPHVSRRHAIVALRGEGVRILDDRSANGTWVNGRKVDVVHLADGDVVRVGRAVFRFVERTAPDEPRRSLRAARSRSPRPLHRSPVALVQSPSARRPVRPGGAVAVSTAVPGSPVRARPLAPRHPGA